MSSFFPVKRRMEKGHLQLACRVALGMLLIYDTCTRKYRDQFMSVNMSRIIAVSTPLLFSTFIGFVFCVYHHLELTTCQCQTGSIGRCKQAGTQIRNVHVSKLRFFCESYKDPAYQSQRIKLLTSDPVSTSGLLAQFVCLL